MITFCRMIAVIRIGSNLENVPTWLRKFLN